MQTNNRLDHIDHKFLAPDHRHMECDGDHSVIERKRKNVENELYHPYDWYRLVESCGKKNQKFKVVNMEGNDFLNFASLLKRMFVQRKLTK